ncbi:MAG: response regulator [Methanomicrobiales archaeon]|nr:response regulator [Methanomicrobiales archaeon]
MIRILLVDDEPDLLELVKRILEQKYGFSTVTAETGDEALQIFKEQSIDAIISDYSMPVMDGILFLRKIRELNNSIPFILFTIHEKEEIAIEAMKYGANTYVEKENLPQVVFAELAHAVTKSVELYRAEKNLKIQRDLAFANANAKSIEETLLVCTRAILDVTGMEGVAIYLVEEGELHLVTASGNQEGYLAQPVQTQILTLVTSIMKQHIPVFRDENEIIKTTPQLNELDNINSDICISMHHHGRIIGAAHIFSYQKHDTFDLSLQRFVSDIIVQVAGCISDRQAEEALKNSENRMKAMIRNLPGIVYQGHIDEERTMEFVSDAVFSLVGYQPIEIIHNAVCSWGSLIHPQDRVRIPQVITRAIEKNVMFRLTYRITTKEKKFRWVLEQGAGIYDTNGGLIGIEGIIMDITRQKLLDDQVRMFHTRLKTLFMLMNSGCAIFRSEGDVDSTILVDINNAAEEIEKKQKNELVGQPFKTIFNNADPSFHDALSGIIQDNKSRNLVKCKIKYPYGIRFFDIFLNIAPVDPEKSISEIFLIYTDVTSRVKTEQQIIASLREKELLFKEIHHRVKNNLQIISGILKLQSLRIDDPRAQEIIQECRNQVYSMASIHELLYNSKDIGKIRLEEYISKLVDHLKHEYEGVSTHLQFIVKTDPKIYLDIERCIPCGLILNELIMNAVKYAFDPDKEGEIRISFTQHEQSYHMQVADNGRGLPKDFDVRKSQSLGMELTSQLTHQLRGKLTISSEKGANFLVTFPITGEGRISI